MAADTAPLVSVIVTSYNYARYIDAAIASVLAQDFPSFELVVVDNASTDETDEVVARFAHDSRLRYHKNATNIGLTPNHNRGLTLSRGTYVLFLSADDVLLPGHLRRCYDYLQAHPSVDVLYTGAVFIDAQGKATSVRSMSGQLPVDYEGGRNEFAAQLAQGCYIPYPSMLIRRALYDELGPMDEGFVAADYEITTRWAAAGKRFAYLRVPSCAIRLHGPQASGWGYVNSGRDLEDYLEILERYLVPENFRLVRGYQNGIITHLRWRAGYYEQSLGGPIPAATVERLAALERRVAAIPNVRPQEDAQDRPLIAIVVRFTALSELLRSLESLAAQQHAPTWEAVVVGEGGHDLTPLLASLPGAGSVRFVRLDAATTPSAARNLGLRLTSAPIVTYMDPGTTYGPMHLAHLANAFAAGPPVVRTDARLLLGESRDGTAHGVFRETLVAGLFRGGNDEERDLVAPAIAISSVAHVRWAIDTLGAFRGDVPEREEWEFWLRLKRLGVAFLPWPTVDVRMVRQRSRPGPRFLDVVQAAYAAYPAKPGTPLALRRAEYERLARELLAQGDVAFADEQRALESLAALAGLDRPTITLASA